MSTLIEKLERERKTHHDLMLQSPTLQDSAYYNGVTVGFMGAIGVVKQHSDWVSVDERLPDDRSLRYELFTPSDDMTLRHRFCHCDDVKKSTDATHWRVAQQPPSEVQP